MPVIKPGSHLALNRKDHGDLVRVLAELGQVAGILLASVVIVRARETDDHVYAFACHQIPDPLPPAITLRDREDRVAPLSVNNSLDLVDQSLQVASQD